MSSVYRLDYTAEEINALLGGGLWTQVAEVTAEENCNRLDATFDPCEAVCVYFQFCGVEDDVGTIYLIPNAKEDPYTSELRGVAATIETSTSAKRGWSRTEIDLRKSPLVVADSLYATRSDGSFGDIEVGSLMNIDIGVTYANNNRQWSLISTNYLTSDPRVTGINSFSALGAGIAKGSTLYIYGVKK